MKLIVDGKEIKEYDSISKFKRFSLINIKNNKIKINGTEINLENFIKIENLRGNSFQLSFYDVQQKFIVSKKIQLIQFMSFSNFYEKYDARLKDFSANLDELIKNKNEFEKNALILFEDNLIFFNIIIEELNLNLPKNRLKNIINDSNHLEFIYNYIKLKFFFIFCLFIKVGFEDLIQIYKYLDDFFKQLKNDNEYENYEKIYILFYLGELFNKVKSCKNFLESNFYYLKADKAKKNSVIKLTLDFLEKYINNLNEESPQYFKLVEIDSGVGHYQGDRIYTYDIIDINALKNHLREAIPNIICFYSNNKSESLAFTSQEFIGLCVNEAKLFKYCEKFQIDEDCFNERKYDVKDVAMKLALNIIHESFSHINFQIHQDFFLKKIRALPRKCFDNKKLKTLVGVNKPIKNNTINILDNPDRGDNRNYLESSLGKLSENMQYTSVYLNRLKNIGNLIDHPELFYNKDNLEILQKYVYYKYLFEKKNEKRENKNKEEQEEEKKYKAMSFKDEFNYLTDFFSKNQNDLTIVNNEEASEAISTNKKYFRKFLRIKRKISSDKKNDEPKDNKIDIKKRNKRNINHHNITDIYKIIKIILTKNLNESEKENYFKMLFNNIHNN